MRQLGVAVALVVALASPPADGAGSQVVLLRGPAEEALARQAETLLAAELRAAGFAVAERERSPGLDLRADIEAAAQALRPIAVLAMVPAARGGAMEVWLSDRVTGKLVIRDIPLTGGGEAETAASDLALRAVELLRGSLLEITVDRAAAPTGAATPPADVARFVAQGARPRRAHFLQGPALGLGAAMVAAAGGLGPSFAPALRLSWGDARGRGLRLSALAPGSPRQVEARDGPSLLGTARVSQALAALDAFLVFRPGARVQPFAAAGAGVRYLRAQGMGASRLLGDRAGAAWSASLQAGGGSALRLGSRASVHLEGQLVLAAPGARILIAGQEAGRTGPVAALLAAGFTTSFF
jgi:hypothetical protein